MSDTPARTSGAGPQPPSDALLRALAANPEQMADLVGALHRRVRDAPTLLDMMGRVSREAVRLLNGVHWAGVTAQFGSNPFTGTNTDQRVLIVDERQYSIDDGPCLRAMREDATVSMSAAQVEAAWPQLAMTARTVGVQSFLGLPLHVNDQSVGSLNLYGAGATVDVDPDLLAVLTGYLDRGLTDYSRSEPHPTMDEALRTAVAGWVVVEQAIGVIMALHGFTADYARDVLYDQAQDWGRTLIEQAAEVLAQSAGSTEPPA